MVGRLADCCVAWGEAAVEHVDGLKDAVVGEFAVGLDAAEVDQELVGIVDKSAADFAGVGKLVVAC